MVWHPEYGSWMLEATPGRPYGGTTRDLHTVERNIALRLRQAQRHLRDDEFAVSMPAFPLMGVGDFTVPSYPPGGVHAESAYVPDAVISPHPRFGTLTANIRRRRGSKVRIMVPVYRDEHTEWEEETGEVERVAACESPRSRERALARDAKVAPAATPAGAGAAAGGAGGGAGTAEEEGEGDPCSRFLDSAADTGRGTPGSPNYIHMDAMAFGMGACCLQVTFQARDLSESRRLYDHLAVLSPVMLALTAASPVWRGKLAAIDTRWGIISAAVDCRTPYERGVEPGPDDDLSWMEKLGAENSAGGGRRRLQKSRYDSVDMYIGNHRQALEADYNDMPVQYDQPSFDKLRAAGVDEVLARHIAHLFVRDALVIYGDRVELDDDKAVDHWENLQSTNWQSVRWKPPPPDTDMGWRVELRTMEVQVTPFENAAFTVVAALLCRVILFFDLNLYIPLSKVDENMRRAAEPRAASEGKFFFRSHVTPLEFECGPGELPDPEADANAYEEMSAEQILLGKGSTFPGLFPLVRAYLDLIKCDPATMVLIDRYLRFVAQRATGEIDTGATWMRRFVLNHPDYKKDSVVSPTIAHDLIAEIHAVSMGHKHPTELIGKYIHPEVVSKELEEDAEERRKVAATAVGDASPLPRGGVPMAKGSSKKLRGASFAEGISESECHVVANIVNRYSVGAKPGADFADTPAYLVINSEALRSAGADVAPSPVPAELERISSGIPLGDGAEEAAGDASPGTT